MQYVYFYLSLTFLISSTTLVFWMIPIQVLKIIRVEIQQYFKMCLLILKKKKTLKNTL